MSFFPAKVKDYICGILRNNNPSNNIVEVAPSDVTIYDPPLRGFTVGESGNVAVLTYDDYRNGLTNPKVIPCVAGADKPVYVVKIFASGTDAANIVGYQP
jgi:hypothetical protein